MISGNRQAGIHLTGTSTATVIEGNIIGLDAAGTAHQGNLLPGILLDGVSGNSVGGNEAALATSSPTTARPVWPSRMGPTNTTVQGNLIGTDPTGTMALGPIQNGVAILGQHRKHDRWDRRPRRKPDLRQWPLRGLHVRAAAPRATSFWATGSAPTAREPSPWATAWTACSLDSAVANTIGGTAPGARNLISANRVQRRRDPRNLDGTRAE